MSHSYNLRKRSAAGVVLLKTTAKECVNIQSMPVVIMIHIFELFDYHTRKVLKKVCNRWRNIIKTHKWRDTTFSDFRTASLGPSKMSHFFGKASGRSKFCARSSACANYLRTVKLNGKHFTYSLNFCWDMLLRSISKNQLQHLEILNYKIDHYHLLKIANRFSTLKSITISEGESKYPSYTDISSLNEFFKICNMLEKLVLDGCDVRNVSFKNVPHTLKSLELSLDWWIENAQLAQICDRCPQLECLQLKGGIDNCDLNLMLSRLQYLKKVVIHGNIYADALFFDHIKELSYLEISPQNSLSDRLLQSIGQISQLKTLVLIDKGEADAELHYTENGLLYLSNLQQLEKLHMDGIRLLSNSNLKAVIQSNPELKNLIIPSCPLITDNSTLYVLHNCKHLNHLDVRDCVGVTKKTLESIILKLVAKHGNSVPVDCEPDKNFFQLCYDDTKINKKHKKNPWLLHRYRPT